MTLNISEFNPNCITAVMDDPLDDLTLCRHAILGYEEFPEVPRFVVYGRIRLAGNYLEIDMKVDETKDSSNRSLNASLELEAIPRFHHRLLYG